MASYKLLIPLTIVFLIVAFVIDNEVNAYPEPCLFWGWGKRHKKNQTEPEKTTKSPETKPKDNDEATKRFEKNFETCLEQLKWNPSTSAKLYEMCVEHLKEDCSA